jgi:hypothetical protein
MLIAAAVVAAFAVVTVAVAAPRAAATTKSLSTVYAIQNFSQSLTATVHVDYKLDQVDGLGAAWTAAALNTDFQLGPGQATNIAQYLDTTLTAGRGSATISSDQPVGAIVNQLNRVVGVRDTSGSYSAFDSGAAGVYAPLVFKNLSTSAGLINSVLTIMNVGSSSTDFNIVYIDGITFQSVFTKTVTGLGAGVSYYADQSDETSLLDGYFGSAVVNATTTGGTLAVVGNQFVGTDALLTYSGFKSTEGFTSWSVPLYLCRLANGFSSPITIQNVSGSSIAANGITIDFTPDPSLGAAPFSISNLAATPNNASFIFNARTDTNCPDGSFGSATITASGNVVVLVNQLQTGAAASLSYNGIRSDSTNTTALSPVAFSRLSNGFSTAITVQNLSSTAGTVTFTYTPNAACLSCGSFTKVLPVAANGSVIQNHRLAEGLTSHPLPAGWFGSATITSDVPIAGVVNQLDLDDPLADGTLSFNTFSQP